MDAVLGIDIAKATVAVALRRADGTVRHKSYANAAPGFRALTHWLQHQRITHVHAGLEATGTYGEALATYLHDAGHTVSLLNPAIIHAYAASQLTRAKTDPGDAALIAQYVATHQPAAWTPPSPAVRDLQAFVRRLDALQGMHTQEANRLGAGERVPAVRASIETMLTTLDAQIADVRRQIRTHIDRHPDLRDQRDLLTSIPGIGDATAAVLLAELFHKRYASARQAAAYAGLVPRVWTSGTLHRRGRLVKCGSGRVRKQLYFPALAAARFNPTLRQVAARLAHAGKPKMVIVGAVMRKLIHLAYGVLKSRHAYVPHVGPA